MLGVVSGIIASISVVAFTTKCPHQTGPINPNVRCGSLAVITSYYSQPKATSVMYMLNNVNRNIGSQLSSSGFFQAQSQSTSHAPQRGGVNPETTRRDGENASKESGRRPTPRAPNGFGWVLVLCGALGAGISFAHIWIMSAPDAYDQRIKINPTKKD